MKRRLKARERIINVAERLFAEKGFHATGVREITSRAGVSLSSVNYYFGSKEGLYICVFKERFAKRAQTILEELESRLSKDGENKSKIIEAVAEAVIMGPLSEEERKLHYKLLVREMANPSPAFDIIMNEAIKPLAEKIISFIKGEYNLSEKDSKMSALSIISQIIFFNFAREMVSSLIESEYENDLKNYIIKHISNFSILGLKGLGKGQL